jgi:hypothetical protein
VNAVGETPLEIYLKYLGNKEIYYIFKICCIISILLSIKCHLFHREGTFLKIKDCEEELSYMQGHLIFTRANETFLLSMHDQKKNGPVFTST